MQSSKSSSAVGKEASPIGDSVSGGGAAPGHGRSAVLREANLDMCYVCLHLGLFLLPEHMKGD